MKRRTYHHLDLAEPAPLSEKVHGEGALIPDLEGTSSNLNAGSVLDRNRRESVGRREVEDNRLKGHEGGVGREGRG